MAQSLYNDRSLLWSNFLVTAEEILLGILVAAVAGFLFAVAIHFFVTLRRAFYPLLIASQTIPIPVIAPILVFWLGFGILPKLVGDRAWSRSSRSSCTTLAGLAAVDPDLLKLMRTFDASRMRDISPRRASHGAARTVHRREDRGRRGGDRRRARPSRRDPTRGSAICSIESIPQLLSARALAAVVILSLFAIALFGLLTVAERLALPWAYQPGGERSS